MIYRRLLVVLLFYCASAFRSYKTKIPNGNLVPHPCKANTLWEGVGHFIDAGTGPRNAFGNDFDNEGHVWTQSLCRKDSDGDGRSNGEELGDPYCLWKENSIPTQSYGITHPGICDPWDSQICLQKNVTHSLYKTQGDWIKAECKAGEFICPAKNESGVRSLDLRVDYNTRVPAKATTYMCQMFDLQTMLQTLDNHMVAVEPIINTREILHHMVLYGCKDSEAMVNGPYECGMSAGASCQDFLSVWTVGLSGDCSHPMAGVRIGLNGYKKVAIQLHWNNPSIRSDLLDNSGLRIYYTPNLRIYDAGIILTGVTSFFLPPKRQSLTVTSTCTSGCTRNNYLGAVNVTMAWNHMHYAGKKMSIEVLRNNAHLLYLTDDPIYSYESPQVYSYTDNPVTLLPGDEIITKCTYDTSNRNHSTRQGEATYDEMCFGFITYFPKRNLKTEYCVTMGPDVNFCDDVSPLRHGCPELRSFFMPGSVNVSSAYKQLVENCRPFSPCLEECLQVIVQMQQSSQCFQGELFEFIKYAMLSSHDVGLDMMARIASCETQAYALMHPTNYQQYTTNFPIYTTKRYDGSDAGQGPFAAASLTTATTFMLLLSLLLTVV